MQVSTSHFCPSHCLCCKRSRYLVSDRCFHLGCNDVPLWTSIVVDRFGIRFEQINSVVYGYAISLPLSIGIAYAYTDMHFEVGASLIALSLTSLTHGVWFYLRAK